MTVIGSLKARVIIGYKQTTRLFSSQLYMEDRVDWLEDSRAQYMNAFPKAHPYLLRCRIWCSHPQTSSSMESSDRGCREKAML